MENTVGYHITPGFGRVEVLPLRVAKRLVADRYPTVRDRQGYWRNMRGSHSRSVQFMYAIEFVLSRGREERVLNMESCGQHFDRGSTFILKLRRSQAGKDIVNASQHLPSISLFSRCQ